MSKSDCLRSVVNPNETDDCHPLVGLHVLELRTYTVVQLLGHLQLVTARGLDRPTNCASPKKHLCPTLVINLSPRRKIALLSPDFASLVRVLQSFYTNIYQ